MNRREHGRGRFLAAVGGLLALVGSFLPWYTVGGEALTARSSNGFEGAGILVFISAVLVLALVLLPYAVSDPARLTLDRAASFALVVGVGVLGLLLRVFELFRQEAGLGALTPGRASGLWIVIVGLALMAWGALDMLTRRRQVG